MEIPSSSPKFSVPSDQQVAHLEYFPAGDDDHRYLRLRCGMLCAAVNAQLWSTSKEERARAWFDIVAPDLRDNFPLPEAPMIKSPIDIDYGVNVHIHPSCFINRHCFIGDSPKCPITIGENRLIGPGVHIHDVTHPVDWRDRKGRNGPSIAGPVTIGRDYFIGSYAVIMPGITIGDGCVIGASSVVTRSIPAYHVAVGSPACPVRKVNRYVPDAQGLRYEQQGDRFVVMRRVSHVNCSADPVSESTPSKSDQVQDAQKEIYELLGGVTNAALRRIAADIVLLMIAVAVFWMVVHGIFY